MREGVTPRKGPSAEPESDGSGRIGLHNLTPAPGSRKPRKRVGRGHGSGMGKTSGRGHKGAGSRSGSKSRAAFEGGQMPIHMRMRKLRWNRESSDQRERFAAGDVVTVETLKGAGLATRKEIPVKVLAKGEITKALTVHAHAFSGAARQAIEAAGGACQVVE